VERLDLTCQLLTRAFLETNANYCAQLLASSQHEIFAATYGSPSSTAASSAPVSVSDKVLAVSRYLDMVTVLGCVLLNETPPPLKVVLLINSVTTATYLFFCRCPRWTAT
jgi:hypothetical protein